MSWSASPSLLVSLLHDNPQYLHNTETCLSVWGDTHDFTSSWRAAAKTLVYKCQTGRRSRGKGKWDQDRAGRGKQVSSVSSDVTQAVSAYSCTSSISATSQLLSLHKQVVPHPSARDCLLNSNPPLIKLQTARWATQHISQLIFFKTIWPWLTFLLQTASFLST